MTRSIDSGRFTEADRVAIIRGVQASHDRAMSPNVPRWGAPDPSLHRDVLVSAGARAIGCTIHDLRDVELAWVEDLARHIALGNRPATYDVPDRKPTLVRALGRLLATLDPDSPDPDEFLLGLDVVRRIVELEVGP